MTVNEKIIKNKLGLLNLAEELVNVSRSCKVMGFLRDTFYRYKAAMEGAIIKSDGLSGKLMVSETSITSS